MTNACWLFSFLYETAGNFHQMFQLIFKGIAEC